MTATSNSIDASVLNEYANAKATGDESTIDFIVSLSGFTKEDFENALNLVSKPTETPAVVDEQPSMESLEELQLRPVHSVEYITRLPTTMLLTLIKSHSMTTIQVSTKCSLI